MPVRVMYSLEYRRVRMRLDSLARRALEEIEDAIADDPELGPHRQQIADGAIFDYHGLQGDLVVRYRRLRPDLVEFEALKDLRNPDL
jgi:hypothetical protein